MPIAVDNHNIFSLYNEQFSYVFKVTDAGLLQHIYFGPSLNQQHRTKNPHRLAMRAMTSNFEGIENLDLNDFPVEYPFFGRSDYRYSAFQGKNADGNSIFSFHYKSHRITKEKPDLQGLPSAIGDGSETLTIILEDSVLDLELNLHYTVYEKYGVLSRSTSILNNSKNSISIEGIASTALNFSSADYEMLHLHGTWAREFNIERIPVPTGRFTIESNKGNSSAEHYPFMVIMENGANEDHGQVYGTTLMYSGNFSISVDKNEYQSVRLTAGINPFGFQWSLHPGQRFTSPEALHVQSQTGLNDMSHQWHQFIRERITPKRYQNLSRSSYLNTWEACYFDVTSTKVLALADHVVDMDLDMIVLDDGWFKGRNDDTSSLGDWIVDKNKFPEGIPWLAEKVTEKGIKFGIWVEPEMVNPQSDLYREHPEWVIQVPNRKASLGRYQLTLDLSQKVVVDYLFDSLSSIFSCRKISYVKWDMNRAMTELGSTALPPDQQGEVSHRYILGLYDLLRRLTDKFPNIIFENCASGGNRCDLGMLSLMAQTWTSDMCDPIGRLDIINGASLLLPNEVLAAYIGPSPNHQNGRVSSLKTRFLAGAFCAARGFSLNESDIIANKAELKLYSSIIKNTKDDFINGKFIRLIKTNNEVCWQYISADESKVFLVYFNILSVSNAPFKKVFLKGLDPNAEYILEDLEESYPGDSLMYSGLPLPYVTIFQEDEEVSYMEKGDFSSHLFVFKKMLVS